MLRAALHRYGSNATYYSLPGRCFSRPFMSAAHSTFSMTHGDFQDVPTSCAQSISDPRERAWAMSCIDHKDFERPAKARRVEASVAAELLDEPAPSSPPSFAASSKPPPPRPHRPLPPPASPPSQPPPPAVPPPLPPCSRSHRYVLCKDDECVRDEPGGECASAEEVGRTSGCTWHAEPLGFVTLDELEGRTGRTDPPGSGYEPSGGICFWLNRDDPTTNAERVRRLDWWFRHKYPDIPGDVDGPRCLW